MSDNPFDAGNAPGVSLIVLLRIYDMLCVIAESVDKAGAEQVEALHEAGKLLAPGPWLDLRPDEPITESDDDVTQS